MLRTYVQTGWRTEEDKTTLCAIQIRQWMLPSCLLLGSLLCAGYSLHLLSVHSPSSELFLALLRHPDICLTWRFCWVQILHASPTSSTTFPFVAHQPCSDEQRTQLWGFFTDISCDQGCSTLLVRQTWQPKQTPALIPCSLCCTPGVSHPFTCTRKLLGSSPT